MKTKNTIYLSCLLLLLAFSRCGTEDQQTAASMSARKGTFEIIIPASGELQAVKSTPIKAPRIRESQTLAWMAAENSYVKKGDVVVRLAGTQYMERIRQEEFAIAKLDLEIAAKERELEKEKKELQNELDIAVIEKEMVELYRARDESIYSRNKIIEDSIDLKYLKQKASHYEKKQGQLQEKARAELQLLQLKKKTRLVKVKQYRDALESLEVKAPHDGLFVYEKNWRGDKPRIGNPVWGGFKLAKLPDLSVMEAKVYVLESEAAGLQKELPVNLVLDSSPGISFNGSVSTVGKIAKPIDRDSPLKYFEVIVKLDKTDQDIMKPGSRVHADIFVERCENVLSVPNQALFFEQGRPFLNIKKGSGFEKREVKTGVRSLTQTIITSGLQEGEKVILSKPGKADEQP